MTRRMRQGIQDLDWIEVLRRKSDFAGTRTSILPSSRPLPRNVNGCWFTFVVAISLSFLFTLPTVTAAVTHTTATFTATTTATRTVDSFVGTWTKSHHRMVPIRLKHVRVGKIMVRRADASFATVTGVESNLDILNTSSDQASDAATVSAAEPDLITDNTGATTAMDEPTPSDNSQTGNVTETMVQDHDDDTEPTGTAAGDDGDDEEASPTTTEDAENAEPTPTDVSDEGNDDNGDSGNSTDVGVDDEGSDEEGDGDLGWFAAIVTPYSIALNVVSMVASLMGVAIFAVRWCLRIVCVLCISNAVLHASNIYAFVSTDDLGCKIDLFFYNFANVFTCATTTGLA
ncbi:hypothetical protein HDU97_000899 [Phlyctochytrium planicorne]|nr:hypothetical protein HDU97_000887 [Phlyctochytrium planicorne]KAJ3102056.1 hypothetical protein HDU97_000899 [Phlyctochytrium planicorne]